MKNFIEKLNACPFIKDLIDRHTFAATASATGTFDPDLARDHWRLDRLSQWCALYCRAKYRRTIRMAQGIVAFEFEDNDDANAFRQATAQNETLITCR